MKQSSHLESSAGTGGTGRTGILPDRETETPVDRMSRSKNSPMKQSTPMESPAVTGGTGRQTLGTSACSSWWSCW